jgi:CheY-like chemotaxis protein
MRILVVDDNAHTAETLAYLVGKFGHETQFAVDAVEGLRLVEAFRPDVALLDLAMPETDGLELARQIRSAGQPITLVAVTGYRNPGSYAAAAKAGFDAYLPKPVNLKLLRVRLQQWAEDLARAVAPQAAAAAGAR